MLRSLICSALLALTMVVACAEDFCDPVTEEGWTVVPSHETVGEQDGAPYQDAETGNWFVERTTTLLPYCSYFNEIGIYSMQSYSLAAETKTERIGICQRGASGGSQAIAPYAGPCPPK